MKEADLKKAVIDYLQFGENAGKWMFFRLNAGSFILTGADGQFRRRVQGAKKGTADLLVIGKYVGNPSVIFLETKSEKGKQTKEQKEFETMVWGMGGRYYIIRDFEEVRRILE